MNTVTTWSNGDRTVTATCTIWPEAQPGEDALTLEILVKRRQHSYVIVHRESYDRLNSWLTVLSSSPELPHGKTERNWNLWSVNSLINCFVLNQVPRLTSRDVIDLHEFVGQQFVKLNGGAKLDK